MLGGERGEWRQVHVVGSALDLVIEQEESLPDGARHIAGVLSSLEKSDQKR